jgi:hypothetical protein
MSNPRKTNPDQPKRGFEDQADSKRSLIRKVKIKTVPPVGGTDVLVVLQREA